MTFKVLYFSSLVGLMCCALANPAYASDLKGDEADPKEQEYVSCEGDCVAIGEWQFSVALGVGGRTNPVVGQSTIPYVILPEVRYYGERFFFENLDVGYTLVDSASHQFHAMFFTPGYDQIFFNRWDLSSFTLEGLTAPSRGDSVVDGPVFDDSLSEIPDPIGPSTGASDDVVFDLRKRRPSGMAGLEYVYTHPKFELQLQALTDVTNVHHGRKIRAAMSMPFSIEQHQFSATFGLTDQSQKLLNYYYGVRLSEVSHASYEYTANSGVSTYARLDWSRPLSEKWVLRGILSYKDLASTITKSPLVEDDGVFTIFFGGVYHF